MIEIDGSQGEGGGQMLRTALALSILTQQAFVIHRIRAKRPKPGLMRQHLACVQAATQVGQAQVQRAQLNSTQLEFVPSAIAPADIEVNMASAGSCTLVLQTVLLPLLCAHTPSRLTLSGGTHNPMAPCAHFLQHAYAPLVHRLGGGLDVHTKRLGFYPAGGGQLGAQITPFAHDGPRVFDLVERGELLQVSAQCLAPSLPRQVVTRELNTLRQELNWAEHQCTPAVVDHDQGPGNALIATLRYANVTQVMTELGHKSISAETVATQLAQQMRVYQTSSAAVDQHLADQLVLLLAVAVWKTGQVAQFTCSEVTDHLTTNARVIEQFLPLQVSFETQPGRTLVQVCPLKVQ